MVTLPVGVLQAHLDERGAVTFDPEPASARAALERLAMGHVARVVLLFREPFWRHVPVQAKAGEAMKRLSFIHAPGQSMPTWWTAYPVDVPRLTGWLGGPRARALLAGGAAAVRRAAIASIAQVTGTSGAGVEAGLVAVHFHDWTADPFSRGAYSYPTMHGANAGRRLARPVEDTLFFAGEATAAAQDGGTVHGALASGEGAAKRLIAALGA